MKKGKVFLGILIGTSAGALLGMLFAPQKGTETRNKISKSSKEYADSARKKFDETIDNLEKKFKKVKNDVSDFAHPTKVKEEKMKNDFGV